MTVGDKWMSTICAEVGKKQCNVHAVNLNKTDQMSGFISEA